MLSCSVLARHCSPPSAACRPPRATTRSRFGIEVARKGLWNEARFRFEKAVALDPDNADALNNLGVALEQQGEFDQGPRGLREGAEAQAGQPLHPAELRPVPGSR